MQSIDVYSLLHDVGPRTLPTELARRGAKKLTSIPKEAGPEQIIPLLIAARFISESQLKIRQADKD